jgi:hypothetical protein
MDVERGEAGVAAGYVLAVQAPPQDQRGDAGDRNQCVPARDALCARRDSLPDSLDRQ